jgi:hypothetical protein
MDASPPRQTSGQRRHQQVVLLRFDRKSNRTAAQREPGHRHRRSGDPQHRGLHWLTEHLTGQGREVRRLQMCVVQAESSGMPLHADAVLSVVDHAEAEHHLSPAGRSEHGFTELLVRPPALPGEVRSVQAEPLCVPLDRSDHPG